MLSTAYPLGTPWKQSPQTWDPMLAVKLMGVIHGVQAFASDHDQTGQRRLPANQGARRNRDLGGLFYGCQASWVMRLIVAMCRAGFCTAGVESMGDGVPEGGGGWRRAANAASEWTRRAWDHALRICSRMTNFHSVLVLGGRSQVLRRFLF
jgi:hypothetical protein